MQLLNNEEKKLLSRLQVKESRVLYSDILEGKYGIENLESQPQVDSQSRIHSQSRISQDRPRVNRSTPQRSNFEDLLNEFNQVLEKHKKQAQTRCAENIFKFGTLIEDQREVVAEREEKKSKPSKSVKIAKPVKQKVGRVEYNDKLIQQLERLMRLRTIDNNFLLEIVKKHIHQCPEFATHIKTELQEKINQIK